jgi:hypothetical protein
LGEIEICTQSQDGMRPQLLSPSRDIGADARACVREPEPLQHRLDAAVLYPLRHQVLERVAAGGIGIEIAVDVEAARLGSCDHVERTRRLAPVVHAGALEVHDLDVHVADVGDLDRLFERFQHLARFIAQVREVAGVVTLDHAAERNHLVRLGVGAGRGE